MTPQKQLFQHDPENGSYGDCWRTCIACLLDLHPSEVPHFYGHDGYDDPGKQAKDTRAWLKARSLGLVEIPFNIAENSIDMVFTLMEQNAPGVHYMLAGTSQNNCNHITIALNDKIVWDPSQTDSGIVGPCSDGFYWVSLLVPLQEMKEAA